MMLPICVQGQIISTVAGGGSIGLGDGGPANLSSFGGAVFGFAIDRHGSLFIADWWGNRLRRVDATTAIITTIAGTGVGGYNGDSIAATAAQLYGPKFVAVDTNGVIYVSETNNQRVRRIDTTGIITTYAGTGFGAGFTGMSHAFSGDGGPATAAEFDSPSGLALDKRGNLFVCDHNNYRIRKIDAVTHQIKTVIGTGASYLSPDGHADSVTNLGNVFDLSFDPYNNIFYADLGDSCDKVRIVSAVASLVTCVAGTGSVVYNGDSISAVLANIGPYHVLCDAHYNFIYISDYINNRIRRINVEDGYISTFAGNGFAGYAGDYGLAKDAQIFEPTHLAYDSCGNIYFADAQNQRIRKITIDSACHFGLTKTDDLQKSGLQSISVYPNPATNSITLTGIGIGIGIAPNPQLKICNIFGQTVFEVSNPTGSVTLDISSWATGTYFIFQYGANTTRFIKNR